MKYFTGIIFLFVAFTLSAQHQVIQLYNGAAPGSENWNWNEARIDSNIFNTPIVYNVSQPTLTVFLPDAGAPQNDAAVIIAPGGGFHVLSIESEGNKVAEWLNKKGITCFVLRYRVAHTIGNDPISEMFKSLASAEGRKNDSTIIPLSIADGKKAIEYVRAHAADYKIDPHKIGIMGFSAGGTVAAAAAFNYTADNRPDFVAPVYPYMPPYLQGEVTADTPPAFFTAASDDQLGLAPHSVELYSKWLAAKRPAELHMYVKGGHGFGMKEQDVPTDNWIERFGDWLEVMQFTNGTAALNDEDVEGMQNTLKDWPNIKRYAAANEKIKAMAPVKNRVVFMGNSITEGWIGHDPDFFSKNPYLDRGIGGQTTPQMLARFREDVIALQPAVVVILGGINDIAENTGYIKPEDTYGNIISMAELARANHIKVVLCSIMPAFDFPWRPGMQPAGKVIAINQMLKAYCEKNHIVYVDYFAALADERKGMPAALSHDGVHPNLKGYKIMEPLVQQGIAAALKN
jgi:acetyl esterase/lipase/lysophospholipase L1-like esterase